ncbi:hypothetical protein CV770_39175 [Bradyrhizobium sp. AC87j1]|nr:hypothetical protein CV770_39175 [Bradyrhizobium sp. AC87j1]
MKHRRLAAFPSPLVGEGGAKRRMRGISPRTHCNSFARREPLTRLRYREATLSHKGRGWKVVVLLRHSGARLLARATMRIAHHS